MIMNYYVVVLGMQQPIVNEQEEMDDVQEHEERLEEHRHENQ